VAARRLSAIIVMILYRMAFSSPTTLLRLYITLKKRHRKVASKRERDLVAIFNSLSNAAVAANGFRKSRVVLNPSPQRFYYTDLRASLFCYHHPVLCFGF